MLQVFHTLLNLNSTIIYIIRITLVPLGIILITLKISLHTFKRIIIYLNSKKNQNNFFQNV